MLVSNTMTAKECGNIYRISSVLKAHQKVHIYLKSHVCKNCGKAFIVNGQLTQYQKIYVRQKSCACKKCGQTFGNFTDHQRTHVGKIVT